MKPNRTTPVARTVATMLMAFGLLFVTSGAANAEATTGSRVSQSTEVQMADLPRIYDGFETRFDCEVERNFWALFYGDITPCRFDVPSRSFWFRIDG